MNIVFVSYQFWPPHFGGELKSAIERFQSLVERGHTVYVLTSGVPGYSGSEVVNGLTVKRSPLIGRSRVCRALRRLIFPLWSCFTMIRIKIDILHHGGAGGINPIGEFFAVSLLNYAAHRKNARAVFVHCLADTEREMFSNKGFGFRLRNAYLKQMDAIVSVSPALHAQVAYVFPEKARLVVYGVHDDIFTPVHPEERDHFRQLHQVSSDEVVFSFLGSIGNRKGADLLINAFAELMHEHPAWRLWLIGPKNRQENSNVVDNEILDLLAPLTDKSDKFHLWGRIDDRYELARILGASDVFVFPSRKEGMGIAPVEAMSVGVPVIISQIPGVTDLANIDGKTGIYIEVNSQTSLQAAMIKLGTNGSLRRSLGTAARERVLEGFGWKENIDEWESLYSSMIRGQLNQVNQN